MRSPGTAAPLLVRAASGFSAQLARPTSGIFLYWVGGLALLLFIGAWWAISFDWHVQHPDLGFYQSVGEAFARGQVPYRDFDPAYPPAALPLLILPSLLGAKEGIWESYALRYEHLALLLGMLLVIATVLALGALRASRGRTILAAALVALSPILVGSILPARFDLWPAALTTGALAAVFAGRPRLGGGILGLAIAAKVYPAVILPLVVIHVWRRKGSGEALATTGWAAVGAVAPAVPSLVVASAGLLHSTQEFVVRPLQVESLGAAILWVAHQVAGVPIEVRVGYGSDNLVGPLPDAISAIQGVLLVLALSAIWAWFARGRDRGRQGLVTVSTAAVCAFIVLGKVLSGQYLIWLIPLVALMEGRRALVAGVLLTAALVLTQQWYPSLYPDWIAGRAPLVTWIVLARDLTLLLLLGASVAPAEWFVPAIRRATVGRAALSRPVPVADGYHAYLTVPEARKE